MSMMSTIAKWLVNLGVKLITSLVRAAAQISGVPNARLPTERDVICEVGGTLIKSVLKAKAKRKVHGFVQKFVSPVWEILPMRPKAELPCRQMPIIDI